MKKFLRNVLLFLLPIILLAYPLDWFLSKTFAKSYWPAGEILLTNDIKAGKINAEVAVYGSSRAWVHFNPAIMKDSLNRNVYNFGIDGHNFWLQYYRHKDYLKHNEKPKVIILAIDVFSLQKREDLFQLEQFLPFMYGDKELYTHLSHYKGYSIYDFYVPLWRYVGKTQAFMETIKVLLGRQLKDPIRVNGFQSHDKSWTDDLAKAKAQNATYTIEVNQPTVDLLEQFIKECKDLNIDLYMVYSPEHIDGQKYIANKPEVMSIFEGFSKKYNIPILDYTKDEICLDTKYFYNSMHLNAEGADVFTKKMVKDLKNQFPHLIKN